MKSNILRALALAWALSFAISACQQPTQSDGSSAILPLSPGGGSSTAHPAITYSAATLIHGSLYQTIGVMDTDGTHATNLVTASATSETLLNPSWSPTGGSIAYQDQTSNQNAAIKAFDVSVNSSGVPIKSNARTIYSVSTSDSMNLRNPAWCSVSGTGKIAFIRQHVGSQLGLSELCTISQSGGAVTVLQSYQKVLTINGRPIVQSNFTYPTWNDGDSKIAVIRADTNGSPGHNTILMVDASTGAITDSIPVAGGVAHLEWSRTGLNKLVFMTISGGSWVLSYCTPTTGSSVTTNSVAGSDPTWSPNNSGIMHMTLSSGMKKLVPFTTTETSVSGGGGSLRWKR